MPTQRDVNIRIAVQDAQKALDQLRTLGVGGENAVKRIVTAYDTVRPVADRAAQGLDRTTEATGRFAGSTARLGNVAQQFQDVAVQIQAGTSASIIFAQQGPQILGAFGPVGAMIGAISGVTVVAASAMLGFGKGADAAKTASNALESATKTLDSAIAGSASSVDDLAGKYRVLSDEMRALERLKLEKVIRDSTTAIDEQKKALAESVRSLIDPQQLEILKRAAAVGQQLNPQYQAPAAAQGNLKFLQDTAEAAKDALDRGDFVGLAKQVDQFAKSSASAEKAFRGFAEGMIEPAESVLKAQEAIEKANQGLGQLAGSAASGAGRARDPFAGFKNAPKELDRVREDIQRGLDAIARTVAEKKAVVDREFAETAAAISKQRSVPGADQSLLDEVEAQAKKLHTARLARIDEEAAKEAEAAKARDAAAAKRIAAAQRVDLVEERRLDAIGLEIEQLKRLDAANRVSAAEYAGVKLQIDAENAARELGAKATPEQIAQMRAEYVERAALQSSIKATTEARERETKVWEDYYAAQAKALERPPEQTDAEKQAQRDVENLQRNLQTNVASAIERGFEDGFGSVGDLVDQFGSLLKSTVATALADQLVTKGFAESISGALGTKMSDLAPSLAGTSAGNVTVGGAAAGVGGAALTGYAVGQQFAGNRPLGVLGGAASGAAIGTAVLPGWGTAIGAGVGAIAGYIGSGQTGGERNNNYQGGYDPVTGQTVSFQNTKPDAGNVSAVQSVLAQLDALRDGLRATGIAFDAAGPLTVQSGNRSGLTLNGESFGSVEDLTGAALRQLLSGAAGLSTGQQTALQHSTAKDAASLLADLGVPEALDALRKPLSGFEQGLKDLTRTYAEANDNAERLGLSTKGLAEAQQRDRDKLAEAYKAELGLVTPLRAGIAGVNEAFATAKRSAEELGVSETDLARERNRQVNALIDAYKAELGLVTPLQQQVANINRQWAEARKNIDLLGLSEGELRAARSDALAATRDAALAQLGFIDPLTQQINAIQAAFQEAAKSAAFLGKSEKELAAQRDKLIAEAQQQALEQQQQSILSEMEKAANVIRADFSNRLDAISTRRQDIAGALDPLQSLRSSILVGDLGGRSTQQRLGSARAEFEKAARDARSGGTTAEEAAILAQRGETLIGLGRSAYGSGAPANDIVRGVLATVNELTGGLTKEDKQLKLAERSLAAQEKAFEHTLPEAIQQGTEVTAKGLAEAKAELKSLRRDFDRLADNITDLMKKLAA